MHRCAVCYLPSAPRSVSGPSPHDRTTYPINSVQHPTYKGYTTPKRAVKASSPPQPSTHWQSGTPATCNRLRRFPLWSPSS
ncbi:hypothetical protein BDV23DRAFT_145216 [Aspergillus alliaceus]|uniref:Uncharacterized protein n=1 Tax=Petromyces alliaceus TaxID=209559 RepID=A0A5N7CN33_PETAA|nr:hypothetical protein BDV23DRAFT_145216 [Aspergillus alliaceus]